MRAAHLPPPHKFPSLFHVLTRPPFLSCSSVTFASFKPPSGCFSTSPPATPYPRPWSRSTYSLPSSSSFPSRWQVRQPRIQDLIPTGKAFCSLVNSGEGDREILVQHLLVSENNSKLILDLQQKISAGVDLSDLAVEYSICPSKKDGGMLGWVKKGQMVPEFEEAAFGAPLNKVVKCKTKFGWHLLQVLSEREGPLLLNIEPEELHSKFQNPGFLEEAQLVDVREPDEVAIASLPGFKVLPLRQFGSWGPGITDELDPQKDTYVLCHHGARSLQVAKWLQTQGFKKVFNVFGGIHAYAVKADSSIPTY